MGGVNLNRIAVALFAVVMMAAIQGRGQAMAETGDAYDGIYFKRGLLAVSDLDRALTLWVDVMGMQVDSISVADADSLLYQLFNVPAGVPLRFATMNAGPRQQRTLGIFEMREEPLPEQTGVRRGGVVINANGRLDAIREALPGLCLEMLREKVLVSDGQGTGIETGFYDWDGNLIVLFQLPNAETP